MPPVRRQQGTLHTLRRSGAWASALPHAEFVTLSHAPRRCARGLGARVVQLCQGLLARHRSMAPSGFIDEPLESFLHKPPYPLVAMAPGRVPEPCG